MIIGGAVELKQQLRDAIESFRLAKENFEFEEQKILKEKIVAIKTELERLLVMKL